MKNKSTKFLIPAISNVIGTMFGTAQTHSPYFVQLITYSSKVLLEGKSLLSTFKRFILEKVLYLELICSVGAISKGVAGESSSALRKYWPMEYN